MIPYTGYYMLQLYLLGDHYKGWFWSVYSDNYTYQSKGWQYMQKYYLSYGLYISLVNVVFGYWPGLCFIMLCRINFQHSCRHTHNMNNAEAKVLNLSGSSKTTLHRCGSQTGTS